MYTCAVVVVVVIVALIIRTHLVETGHVDGTPHTEESDETNLAINTDVVGDARDRVLHTVFGATLGPTVGRHLGQNGEGRIALQYVTGEDIRCHLKHRDNGYFHTRPRL